MADTLITRYRPLEFDDILGQEHIIASIKEVVEADSSHAFIFTGPAGTGKTSLARIIATKVGCTGVNLLEIDAATNTGVDDMREVISSLRYQGFGVSSTKCIIIDESHMLSKSAWASLLKVLEEPPQHVYWMLCTTDAHKIPDTIKTRCLRYDLKPVPKDLIFEHLHDIAQIEGFKTNEGVIDLITREAYGSVRKAIADLAACADVTERKVAADLLKTAGEDSEVLSLCQLIAKGQGFTWAKAMVLLQGLQDLSPESIRIMIIRYFTKAAMGAKDEQAFRYLAVISAFSEPCNQSDGLAPILLALGSLIYADD